MSDVHTVVPRTMCFVFFEDEVLMLKANASKDWNGIYDPLGGHIEKGESIIDNANREIKEESGLDVKDTKLRGIVHVTGFFGKNIILFVTSSKASIKDVVSNEEGELEWIKTSDLDEIRIFEDVKPILKHVLEMKPGEIFVATSVFDGKDKLESLDIKIS